MTISYFVRILKIPFQLCAQLIWPITQYRKRSVFLKFSSKHNYWIETGTFKGRTTNFLSAHNLYVHSIEPSQYYYNFARNRLMNKSNVQIHFGTSKDTLKKILSLLDDNRALGKGSHLGKSVFFLDGHFSGGLTFMDSGSPILEELEIIDQHYGPNFADVCILIDDARLFKNNTPGYPSLDFIKSWAFERGFSVKTVKDIIVLEFQID